MKVGGHSREGLPSTRADALQSTVSLGRSLELRYTLLLLHLDIRMSSPTVSGLQDSLYQ